MKDIDQQMNMVYPKLRDAGSRKELENVLSIHHHLESQGIAFHFHSHSIRAEASFIKAFVALHFFNTAYIGNG
jgi:hypothetical protein